MNAHPARKYFDLKEEEVLQLQERLGALPTNSYYLLGILLWVALVFYLSVVGSMEEEKVMGWAIFVVAGLLLGGLAIYGLGAEKRKLRMDLIYRSKYLRGYRILKKERYDSPERFYLELADIAPLLPVAEELYQAAKIGDIIQIGHTRFARHRLDEKITTSTLIPNEHLHE